MSNDQSDNKKGTYNPVGLPYAFPPDMVKSDPQIENFFVANTGIKLMHYISMPDPLYKVEAGAIRQSFDQEENGQFQNNDRFYRENGFLYFKKAIIMGNFQSNTKDLKNLTAGLYTSAGASMTLNRYYEGTDEKIEISENDKLVPCELEEEFHTTIAHEFQHNPTGIDRLQFPANKIVMLIDSAGKIYNQDEAFTVCNGVLTWIAGQDRPGIDPVSGHGRICSVRYTYKPYFYIKLILKDIRVKPTIDRLTGQVTVKAGPVLVQLQADWVYLNERTQAKDNPVQELNAADTENVGPR